MDAQQYADMVNSGSAPWKGQNWSDSTKQQYLAMLNADQANEHELEMWRLNNEYNTPEKQMQRYIEAGINPALAYQNITGGNSGSAPGVHMSDTPTQHDTQDKLATAQTIMSGIRDLISTVGQGVDAYKGIQDIAIRNQNNWYDAFRASAFGGSAPTLFTEADVAKLGNRNSLVQVAPGLYAQSNDLMLYPEFFYGLKTSFAGGNYDLGVLARKDQHALVERRDRIDGLVQQIFKAIESGAPSKDLVKLFLQLMTYTTIQNYGGGF